MLARSRFTRAAFGALAALGTAAVLAAGTAAAQEPTGLPGGASSLRESHGDWTVGCSLNAQGGKVCALSQEQQDSRSGQRVFAAELRPAQEGGGAEGLLVLPFGLALEEGVSLRVDESEQSLNLPFRTCLPAGCLVRLELDEPVVEALRAGSLLTVSVVADGGEGADFPLSLRGFTSALNRTTELLR